MFIVSLTFSRDDRSYFQPKTTRMHLGYTLKKIQQLQKMIEIPIEGISSFWPGPDTKHKKYSGVCSYLSTFLFLCYHH